MATLIIPDVDEGTIAQLRADAEARGGSLEADMRDVLAARAEALIADRQRRAEAAAAHLRRYREQMRDRYGAAPDTLEGLRADRASW